MCDAVGRPVALGSLGGVQAGAVVRPLRPSVVRCSMCRVRTLTPHPGVAPVNPAALLLEQAPDALFAPVLARLDGVTREAALGGYAAPGPRLSAHILDNGDARERAVLAGNLGLQAQEFTALATGAEAEVAARLLVNRRAPREALLRVLPVAPTFAVIAEAAVACRDEHGLQTCVAVCAESPDPVVVRAALAHLDEATNALGRHAVILRGCLTLLDTEGPGAVSAALAAIPPPSSQRSLADPSAPVVAALAAPTERPLLAAAIEHEGGTPVIIRRLRHERHPGSFDAYMRDHERYDERTFALLLASPRAPLDWDAILRAHQRAPFGRLALRALAYQRDCPPTLAKAGAERVGRLGRRSVAERLRPGAARRRLIELMAPSPTPTPTGYAPPHHELAKGYAKGLLSAGEVLRGAHGAQAGLGVFASARDARLEAAQRELAAMTHDTLGNDADAWVVALTLLPEFAGTVGELLRTAAATTA